MSEEPSTDTPADDAPESQPARLRRRRPQRSILILGGAAVVSAAAIAAALLIAVQPAVKPPEYGRLPAPCAMVSRVTLARYLPNPTGTPEVLPSVGTGKQEYCKWSRTAGGEDRTVVSDVTVFSSSGANSEARQFYTSTLPVLACHCPGTAVSTRSVPGLGDQATALFVTAGPDAADISASGGPAPGLILLVDSRNAYISLSYSVTVTATGAALPADATKLTWMIAVARGILADLARPAAVTAAPVSAEPSYAGSRDPCRLLTSATLARYAPGATVTPDINPNGTQNPSGVHTSTCSWASGTGPFIQLNLGVFPDARSALQGFTTDAVARSQARTGITATGSRWLTDLGDEAAAIYENRSASHGVEVLVRSGNVELDYWFGPSSALDRATLLAAGVAMARDGLAALASRSASSYPQGPVYASPHDACTLIKALTLARYAPGATVDVIPLPNVGGLPQLSDCGWGAQNGSLSLFVSIYADADGALGGYQIALQTAYKNPNGNTFDGARPVKGLGDQATAVFETSLGNPEVDLYVVSGNADIEMSFTDVLFGPTLSRAGKLAADVAMARDVLADLPVTR